MKYRNITASLLEALSDSPVVLLHGARQTGKSTLAMYVAKEERSARYITLDDATALAAVKTDPEGFVKGLEGDVVLDEIQRAPELFMAIKGAVDRQREPGRFLLTGSANVLLLPRLSESLAGRMEILALWPFSQGELEGRTERFVDAVFGEDLPETSLTAEDEASLFHRITRGGFPEAVERRNAGRRNAWFRAYITTILQREVNEIVPIDGLTQMPRLLTLLAARSGTILNSSEISRSSGIPFTTLRRYMTLLEMTFLIRTIPAWSGNLSKRLMKAPKLILCDTGLLSHLTGLTDQRIAFDRHLLGPVLESFVIMELMKQATWAERFVDLFHFRTQIGQEIDIILEDAGGRMVGIEVKSASTVNGSDFKGLNVLADARKKHFHRGIVLYLGSQSVNFSSNMHAVPLSALWQW